MDGDESLNEEDSSDDELMNEEEPLEDEGKGYIITYFTL